MGVGGQRAKAKPMEEGRPLRWEVGRIKAEVGRAGNQRSEVGDQKARGRI